MGSSIRFAWAELLFINGNLSHDIIISLALTTGDVQFLLLSGLTISIIATSLCSEDTHRCRGFKTHLPKTEKLLLVNLKIENWIPDTTDALCS